MTTTRRTLTPEQRAFWTDSLAAGVPENVILEFERDLDASIDEWTAIIRQHVTA